MKVKLLIVLTLIGLSGLGISEVVSSQNNEPKNSQNLLLSDSSQSIKAFQVVLKVLKDPRCINCHPTGDRPRVGDNQQLHNFNVQRGSNDHGGLVQKCQSCHQQENNPYTKIPGAPHWSLAPKSMGWYGLSDVEIGKRLVDPALNGDRTPTDLVKHMTEDKLVLWGWEPGEGRTPVKVPFDEFKTALNTWLETGAYVPVE